VAEDDEPARRLARERVEAVRGLAGDGQVEPVYGARVAGAGRARRRLRGGRREQRRGEREAYDQAACAQPVSSACPKAVRAWAISA
jgi:hypothetical protein